MSKFIITFRSATFAQRGEGVLRMAHIRCALSRTPRWMEEQGCGYALKIHCEDIEQVLSVLQREKIAIRRVYLQNPDGTLEVVRE